MVGGLKIQSSKFKIQNSRFNNSRFNNQDSKAQSAILNVELLNFESVTLRCNLQTSSSSPLHQNACSEASMHLVQAWAAFGD